MSGCGRLRSAVRTEYARKLSGGQAFLLVTALSPMDCKSIAKASKVRILHLPPRAERAPDLRKRRTGALACTRRGYPKRGWMSRSSRPWPQGCDLHKRERRTARVVGRTEYGGKFGSRPPCCPDCQSADLWAWRGWGYAMGADFRTIAIEEVVGTRLPSVAPDCRGRSAAMGGPTRLLPRLGVGGLHAVQQAKARNGAAISRAVGTHQATEPGEEDRAEEKRHRHGAARDGREDVLEHATAGHEVRHRDAADMRAAAEQVCPGPELQENARGVLPFSGTRSRFRAQS
jgi:hypothetical protein